MEQREVPFRISSNPFIANAYAQVIRGYLRDTANDANGPAGSRGSVRVLELGAGSGQFGFLLARALSEIVAAGEPETLPRFRYLMTDVAESNVRAWPAHPRLKPLVEAGVMKFAVLDASAPAEARLAGSSESLAEAIGGNPVVVIANHFLDVLVHDAFWVEDGVLREVRVGLDLEKELPEVVGSRELFNTMQFHRDSSPAGWPYYPEAGFDTILKEYARALKSATFLFPVAALRCLEALRRLTGGRLLLLVSDKARTTPQQLRDTTA